MILQYGPKTKCIKARMSLHRLVDAKGNKVAVYASSKAEAKKILGTQSKVTTKNK